MFNNFELDKFRIEAVNCFEPEISKVKFVSNLNMKFLNLFG